MPENAVVLQPDVKATLDLAGDILLQVIDLDILRALKGRGNPATNLEESGILPEQFHTYYDLPFLRRLRQTAVDLIGRIAALDSVPEESGSLLHSSAEELLFFALIENIARQNIEDGDVDLARDAADVMKELSGLWEQVVQDDDVTLLFEMDIADIQAPGTVNLHVKDWFTPFS